MSGTPESDTYILSEIFLCFRATVFFSFWYKLLYNLEKYEYFIWNIENNWNIETGEQREREKTDREDN